MDVTGKWEAEKKDEVLAAMKTIGVPHAFVKHSTGMKLQLEILRDGDKYTFKETIMLPLSEHTVKLGQGFETTDWLGKTIKGSVDKDRNKIVEKSKEDDVSYETTYQAEGSKLIRTRDYTSSKCSLTYTKV